MRIVSYLLVLAAGVALGLIGSLVLGLGSRSAHIHPDLSWEKVQRAAADVKSSNEMSQIEHVKFPRGSFGAIPRPVARLVELAPHSIPTMIDLFNDPGVRHKEIVLKAIFLSARAVEIDKLIYETLLRGPSPERRAVLNLTWSFGNNTRVVSLTTLSALTRVKGNLEMSRLALTKYQLLVGVPGGLPASRDIADEGHVSAALKQIDDWARQNADRLTWDEDQAKYVVK